MHVFPSENQYHMQIRGRAHQKGNNESLGSRVLVDAGGDGKQGIYFAWFYT